MTIASINPTTGETLQRYESLTSEAVEQALTQAQAAFVDYARTTFAQRAAWMHNAADILEARKQDFGKTMTLDRWEDAEKCDRRSGKMCLGLSLLRRRSRGHVARRACDYRCQRELRAVLAYRAFC